MYYVLSKSVTWTQKYGIEADSLKEAKKLLEEQFKNGYESPPDESTWNSERSSRTKVVEEYPEKPDKYIRNSREFLERLVDRVYKANPDVADIDLYGPFGMRAYSSLYATDKGGDIIGSLTVESTESGWKYETGRKNGMKCDPMSIAALNGFDNEVAPLPEDKDEVVKLVFTRKYDEE